MDAYIGFTGNKKTRKVLNHPGLMKFLVNLAEREGFEPSVRD